jgi:hypothetical protein
MTAATSRATTSDISTALSAMASPFFGQPGTPGEARAAATSPQHKQVSKPANVAPDRAVLLFSPSPAQRSISESFDKIPTYLFRLHGPSTVGTTTTLQVSSPAFDKGMDKGDLFQQAPVEAAKCLDEHLRWSKAHEDKGECNFMSWSSSLLFLLQYALYRQNKERHTISLSQMRLLVLDTRQFRKGTFIRDLEAINAFSRYNESLRGMKGWREGKYYFGEYLSQGYLDVAGSCEQISIQQLLDRGHLYELCPKLRESNRLQWVYPVLAIRDHFGSRHAAQPTDKREVRIAITMAQGFFGSHFALPVAAMLLSLRQRKPDDKAILDGFCSMFSSELQDSPVCRLGLIPCDGCR